MPSLFRASVAIESYMTVMVVHMTEHFKCYLFWVCILITGYGSQYGWVAHHWSPDKERRHNTEKQQYNTNNCVFHFPLESGTSWTMFIPIPALFAWETQLPAHTVCAARREVNPLLKTHICNLIREITKNKLPKRTSYCHPICLEIVNEKIPLHFYIHLKLSGICNARVYSLP